MRPTPFRRVAGRSIACAALLAVASTALAQNEKVQAGMQSAGSAVAQGTEPKRDGVVVLGGTLPGGAILSSAVASLKPAGGSAEVTCPIGEDGTFSFKGLKPGAYELRISFPAGPRQSTDTSTSRQTPKTDFGSVVKSGDKDANTNKAKHDTAKNAIGNIRAREQAQAGGVSVAAGDVDGDGRAESAQAAVSSVSTMAGGAGGGAAAASYAKMDINGGMPNRISMNVTTPKLNFTIETGGAPVVVQVGADGTFAARATVNQQQQGAEPATSGRTTPDPASPSGGTPPRPSGG